jgi:RluA family pseudouridine synthase
VTASLPILYQGNGFLAVDKPPGVLVIPGRASPPRAALREQLEAALGRSLWVVHRLDRETSGVLLFALDPVSHRTLSMAFESGAIRKTYLALVAGRLEHPLELQYPLVPARRGRVRVARDREVGKSAHTRVRPLELFDAATWVELEPLTGRQHQIRVHLAAAGFPLWVDAQYGRAPDASSAGLSRTPLHASMVKLPALPGLDAAEIRAPLSADLEHALAWWRGDQRST